MTRHIHTASFSHTQTRIYTGGDTQKPCNWISCRKQTFSCKHIICHLYSLIHILYAKWRHTRAHTHTPAACQTNKWSQSPCESHHHDHPSFIITLACSITQQYDPAWNQLASHASTVKCTLPILCFGLTENNVLRPEGSFSCVGATSLTRWKMLCTGSVMTLNIGKLWCWLWLFIYLSYSFRNVLNISSNSLTNGLYS